MAKSTAVSEAQALRLKDELTFRGFVVSESKDSEGHAKLTLNTDEASICIKQVDAVSKDVFGNDLKAFTPHVIEFASRNDAMDSLKVAKIMAEIGKVGMAIVVKTDADDLGDAEASAGEKLEFEVRWATKGR